MYIYIYICIYRESELFFLRSYAWARQSGVVQPEVGRESKKALMSFSASVCPYETAASNDTVLCPSLRTAVDRIVFFKLIFIYFVYFIELI